MYDISMIYEPSFYINTNRIQVDTMISTPLSVLEIQSNKPTLILATNLDNLCLTRDKIVCTILTTWKLMTLLIHLGLFWLILLVNINKLGIETYY